MCNTTFCFLLTCRAHPFICSNKPFARKISDEKNVRDLLKEYKNHTQKCVCTFYNITKHTKKNSVPTSMLEARNKDIKFRAVVLPRLMAHRKGIKYLPFHEVN